MEFITPTAPTKAVARKSTRTAGTPVMDTSTSAKGAVRPTASRQGIHPATAVDTKQRMPVTRNRQVMRAAPALRAAGPEASAAALDTVSHPATENTSRDKREAEPAKSKSSPPSEAYTAGSKWVKHTASPTAHMISSTTVASLAREAHTLAPRSCTHRMAPARASWMATLGRVTGKSPSS